MSLKQLPDQKFENSGIARPYAYIYKTPLELESLLGIEFVHTYDELDYCDIALLEISNGLLFGLVHHKRAPGPPCTTILGHERSQHPREELEQFMKELGWTYGLVIPCYEKITDSIAKDILSGKFLTEDLPQHFEIILSDLIDKVDEPILSEVIFQASLRFPFRVQRRLSTIFFHKININNPQRSTPWKNFEGDVDYLKHAVKSKFTKDIKRDWALENLMETRVPENVSFALEHSKNPEVFQRKFEDFE